jgi:adenosine deaminase
MPNDITTAANAAAAATVAAAILLHLRRQRVSKKQKGEADELRPRPSPVAGSPEDLLKIRRSIRGRTPSEGVSSPRYSPNQMRSWGDDRIPIPTEFLEKIPKTDLHVHLDGSIRLETLIELAQEYNVELPAYTVEGLKEKVFKDTYADLPAYLQGFALTGAVMQTAAALERVSFEFAIDNYSEGVHYFECRFAPQLHASDNLSVEEVLLAVNRGLEKATNEANAAEAVVNEEIPGFAYGIIVCGLRMFMPMFSTYYKHFCAVHPHEEPHRLYGLATMALVTTAMEVRKKEGIPIVALDIAGAENGFPAKDHAEAYEYAQKNFLQKTVHAGEAAGPESIHQAITNLFADRIGHGYHLFSADKCQKPNPEQYVNDMVQFVASRRIMLEVCLTSNIQTMPELNGDLKNHAFTKMLQHRISVSINTDNRTVSNTTCTKELRLAVDTFGMTPKQLRDVVTDGFKRSFFPKQYAEKRKFVRSIMNYYAKLEKEYGLV